MGTQPPVPPTIDQAPCQVEATSFAGHAIQLNQSHLKAGMTSDGPALTIKQTALEGPNGAFCGLNEPVVPGCSVMRSSGAEEMAHCVRLVGAANMNARETLGRAAQLMPRVEVTAVLLGSHD